MTSDTPTNTATFRDWPHRVIRRSDTVVCVLTGHILKDSDILLRYHRDTEPPPARANRPLEIDADIAAVERVLAASRPTDG